MIPILYQTITEGTVPTGYGLGPLTDCLKAEVKEERNGAYELTLSYAAEGIHAEDIQPNRFIMAKPNYTDNPQLFRIYKVGKTINGRFEVSAQHISYDLSGKIITTGSASSCVAACALLEAQAGNFTINTDKAVSAAFSVSEPSSVRSWFGGKQGSLLEVYGGEWKYDNYTASLKQARGADRNVTIRYGKNLTELNQDVSIENLVTGIVPFYIDTNGNKTVGTKVSTGLVLDVDRDLAIDFSQDVDPESATPIATQLANLANRYISNNELTSALNNITLNFVQLEGLTERVDLCDTVHIYYEPLGITATAKCIATVWDVLKERYTKTTFGSPKTNIADTIATQAKEVAQAPSISYMSDAITHATQLITGNLGGYVILHDANGDGYPDEILIMNTPDITTATQVWRWNKDGLGYATSYAGPYNTLALTSDGQIVATAITSGVLNADLIKAGTISDINNNSSIDMTSGVAILKNMKAKQSLELIDSNNVKRGFFQYIEGSGEPHLGIVDANNQALAEIWGNANGGQVRLQNPSGKRTAELISTASGGYLYVDDSSGNINAYIEGSTGNFVAKGNATVNGTYTGKGNISLTNSNNNTRADIFTSAYDRGNIYLYDENNKSRVALFGDGIISAKDGTSYRVIIEGATASVNVNNSSGQTRGYLNANAGYGKLQLQNSGGGMNIDCDGSSGVVTCVSVVQSSSREVKENIKPIEDADKVLELQAVSFDYKDKNRGTDKRGFIAEDVREVLPNLVVDGETPSLDYIGMIPYLQDVIRRQEERIKVLEDKIKNIGG